MIIPFSKENLKPAGYELTLGAEYAIGGERKTLQEQPDKDVLTIPPFQVVIISTREIINLPRFILARWDLRVSKVYDGLLWTGALQVDPGWCGRLHCPIYNLSNEKVILKLHEPVVLMDFEKTTPFNKKETIVEYPRPPKRANLKDYNWKLKSALFSYATDQVEIMKDRMDRAENRIDSLANRFNSTVGVIFTTLAIIFAAISLFVTSSNKPLALGSAIWIYVSMGISIFALYFALSKNQGINGWLKNIMVLLFIIFITLIVMILGWQFKNFCYYYWSNKL
jgi:deoxycytidine triphosphate deaminase